MLYIVITDYNGWQSTRSCLRALDASRNCAFRTIVVDHGTTRETAEGLSARYPDTTALKGNSSLWWTGATNLGIREALKQQATAIMLLNNDCEVEPDTISVLLAHAETCPDAIVAPLQISKQSRHVIQPPVTCFTLGFPSLSLPGWLTSISRNSGLKRVSLISGGRAAIIPAGVFMKVGLLDEETFPHYCSDHDFYLRCTRQGIPLFICSDAFVYVDNVTTTIASDIGRLTIRQFLDTFKNTKSHKNIRDLGRLFERYYPLKGMHHLGLALNLLRYTLIYFWKRLLFLLRLDRHGHS